MIDGREILEAARALSLVPRVVEKDYVLGWVLAGIESREAIAQSWAFKGGTCLKKCYFETYRFSEDLDFTVTEEAQLNEEFLRDELSGAADWVYEASGVDLLPDRLRFDVYRNQRGGLSCEGRVYYRGPLAPRGDPPRIKLDLTVDELVVRESVIREVHHPYGDRPAQGIHALCYCFEELFAEKLRALGERCRPRDLYDVVHLYRRQEGNLSASDIGAVLTEKCRFKGIGVPTMDTLQPYREELDAEWSNMLSHQLQALPEVEGFWDELPEILAWLATPTARRAAKPSIPAAGAGAPIPRAELYGLPRGSAIGSSGIQSIYFAGANRLCVDLRYKGTVRRIEPYSLRRTRDGKILLYACHASDGAVRAYRLDRIEGAEVTSQPFRPRFAVELTERGPVSISPTATRSPASGGFRAAPSPRRSGGTGFKYVVECPVCGRQFKRKTRDTGLRPHKDKVGWPCPGSRGMVVDTVW